MEIVGGGTAAWSRPMGEELPTSTPSSGSSLPGPYPVYKAGGFLSR